MFKRAVLLVAILIMTAGICAADQGDAEKDHVAVYYFHGDVRCVNCHRIETYTKEAVDEYFGKELESGELMYKVVNVDRKKNQHFVKEYQLYTKSVVVSLVKGGKEVKYENLQGVWDYLGNRGRFLSYIKNKIGKYLEELG